MLRMYYSIIESFYAIYLIIRWHTTALNQSVRFSQLHSGCSNWNILQQTLTVSRQMCKLIDILMRQSRAYVTPSQNTRMTVIIRSMPGISESHTGSSIHRYFPVQFDNMKKLTWSCNIRLSVGDPFEFFRKCLRQVSKKSFGEADFHKKKHWQAIHCHAEPVYVRLRQARSQNHGLQNERASVCW